METNDKKGMARREFLKRLGVGTAATAAALTGCDSRRNAATGDRTAQGEIPTDRMTYRTRYEKHQPLPRPRTFRMLSRRKQASPQTPLRTR